VPGKIVCVRRDVVRPPNEPARALTKIMCAHKESKRAAGELVGASNEPVRAWKVSGPQITADPTPLNRQVFYFDNSCRSRDDPEGEDAIGENVM
jgi:hypothetical protein